MNSLFSPVTSLFMKHLSFGKKKAAIDPDSVCVACLPPAHLAPTCRFCQKKPKVVLKYREEDDLRGQFEDLKSIQEKSRQQQGRQGTPDTISLLSPRKDSREGRSREKRCHRHHSIELRNKPRHRPACHPNVLC